MPASALAHTIANEIALLINSGELLAGAHLKTQAFADKFGVSRSPVREAMQMLSDQGVLVNEENRGFFVSTSQPVIEPIQKAGQQFEPSNDYQRLAEDWLTEAIPAEVTEQMLRERYKVTKAQLNDMLLRASREGWAEPKQGYGWRFLPVAKTPESFEQIYRFRMLIEPAAMLEPSFTLEKKIIEEQRRIQTRMLEADIDRLPAERLLHSGSLFHEELMKMSNNPFFYMALVRVNLMRRLMEYRSRIDHSRLIVQCQEHLQIVDLLDRGEIVEASNFMRAHLLGALSRKSPAAWSWSGKSQSEVAR